MHIIAEEEDAAVEEEEEDVLEVPETKKSKKKKKDEAVRDLLFQDQNCHKCLSLFLVIVGFKPVDLSSHPLGTERSLSSFFPFL